MIIINNNNYDINNNFNNIYLIR